MHSSQLAAHSTEHETSRFLITIQLDLLVLSHVHFSRQQSASGVACNARLRAALL